MYDVNFSALRAFLWSESKTKFSRMRAVAPSGVELRFTIAEFGALRAGMAKFELLRWLTFFIQRKRMGNGFNEPRENFIGTRVSFPTSVPRKTRSQQAGASGARPFTNYELFKQSLKDGLP